MKGIAPIRWTVGNAASEFGIDPKTLSARIKARSIEPGKDGRLSTLQICDAVFGDLESEKIGLTREQKEIAALNKSQMLRETCTVAMVDRVWQRVMLEFRQRVMSANIPDVAKKDLLEPLTPETTDVYFEEADNKNEGEQ